MRRLRVARWAKHLVHDARLEDIAAERELDLRCSRQRGADDVDTILVLLTADLRRGLHHHVELEGCRDGLEEAGDGVSVGGDECTHMVIREAAI